MYLIIDIGNSRVKYHFEENTYLDIKDVQALKPNSKPRAAIVVSTVPSQNPKQIELIQDIFGLDFEIFTFDPLSQNEIQNFYFGIGADRAAKLIGAKLLMPNRDIALFDFGTATTLSTVSSKSIFTGGFITLGFASTLRSLAVTTAALPDLSATRLELLRAERLEAIHLADRDTNSAILNGTYLMHEAMLDRWLVAAKEQLSNPITICTGGLADIFKSKFDNYISDSKLLSAFATKILSIPA